MNNNQPLGILDFYQYTSLIMFQYFTYKCLYCTHHKSKINAFCKLTHVSVAVWANVSWIFQAYRPATDLEGYLVLIFKIGGEKRTSIPLLKISCSRGGSSSSSIPSIFLIL